MAHLKYLQGAKKDETVELKRERVVLGRKGDCDIVLNEQGITREHAIIRKIQGRFYIEDNESRNHTFLNNKQVLARTVLKHRDKIKICDVVLEFLENTLAPLPAGWRTEPDDGQPEEDSSTVQATLSQTSKQVLEAQPAERLAMLLDVGTELTQTFDLDQLLPKIVDKLFAVFRQADRGFLIVSDKGRLIPRVSQTRRNDDAGARFSRSIVNRVLESGQSILSADASAGGVGGLVSQSIVDYRIRSVMCVPMFGRSSPKPIGVLQLDTQDRFKQFTPDDLKLLLAVAGQAAVALENAEMHATILQRTNLDRDLQLARDVVQRIFLPLKTPQLPGYEFWAHYEAAQEVGGDYYDFIPVMGGCHGIMVGDVAGKGIAAALLMAKVSADARFCALTEAAPAAIVTKLNEHLQEAGRLDRFVTLVACLLNAARHEVTFVNAGHPAPLVYRKATGAIEEGTTAALTGLPLGIIDGIPYESNTIRLDPGDCVLLMTDGIADARNKSDKSFNMDGVHGALRAGPMTPRAMVERLLDAVHKHAIGCRPFDDLTLVAFGRSAGDPGAAATDAPLPTTPA